MKEVINGLLDIERKAQDIAHEANDLQDNYEKIISEKNKGIKKAIDQENKLILKQRLEDEEKKLKKEIKEIRAKTHKKIVDLQAGYVLNKEKVEEKIFNTIIGR